MITRRDALGAIFGPVTAAMRFRKLDAGEWVEVGDRWVHICCDCMLTHRVEMDYNLLTEVHSMRWTRDEERTARMRRMIIQHSMPEYPNEVRPRQD